MRTVVCLTEHIDWERFYLTVSQISFAFICKSDFEKIFSCGVELIKRRQSNLGRGIELGVR